MNRYRVSVERVLPDPRVRNPFRQFRTAESIGDATCKVLVRTWEFEAKDECEVRKLFEEAKQSGEPKLLGMKLRAIENIS